MPSMGDILKTDVGSIAGLAKSKKYALTAAWVSLCAYYYGAASTWQERVAALAAGTIVIVAYLFANSSIAKAAALNAPLPSPPSSSPTPISGAKTT